MLTVVQEGAAMFCEYRHTEKHYQSANIKKGPDDNTNNNPDIFSHRRLPHRQQKPEGRERRFRLTAVTQKQSKYSP